MIDKPCCCKLKLKIKDERKIRLKILCSGGGGGHWSPYEGAYSVIPKVYQQILETKNKLMSDDVTIYEIPYTEVSNLVGTTVIIATD